MIAQCGCRVSYFRVGLYYSVKKQNKTQYCKARLYAKHVILSKIYDWYEVTGKAKINMKLCCSLLFILI